MRFEKESPYGKRYPSHPTLPQITVPRSHLSFEKFSNLHWYHRSGSCIFFSSAFHLTHTKINLSVIFWQQRWVDIRTTVKFYWTPEWEFITEWYHNLALRDDSPWEAHSQDDGPVSCWVQVLLLPCSFLAGQHVAISIFPSRVQAQESRMVCSIESCYLLLQLPSLILKTEAITN